MLSLVAAILVIGGTVGCTLIFDRMFGRHVPPTTVDRNQVGGRFLGVTGALLGMLLSFTIGLAWNHRKEAASVSLYEFSAASNLYRVAETLGGPTGEAIRKGTIAYFDAIVKD